MIDYLRLKNFRAFRNQEFEFSRINVFVGPNNSGKSSAISALNLIAQSITTRRDQGTALTLNGEYEELGTYIDAVHGNRSNTPISIELGYNESSELGLTYKYKKIDEKLRYLNLHTQTNQIISIINTKQIQKIHSIQQ